MSGKLITKKQKEFYMKLRNQGDIQELAASKTGISARSAKRIDKPKPLHSNDQKRGVKKDPFEDVWLTELVPLLEKEPTLQAITLLDELQARFPGRYDTNLLRTLQRRLKEWKGIHGPDKEIMFRQNHPPGWQGLSDFTCCNSLQVTIRGIHLHHLIYRYCLAYSHWEYPFVVLGGESFTALSEGFQNAHAELGGCPQTHRTDSLAAAYKNREKSAEEDFTESYKELCDYYEIEPTRNNKGVSHENGSAEVSHRHFKSRLNQALMLRGSRDFDSLDDYRQFVKSIADKQNAKRHQAIHEEKMCLHKLPNYRSRDFEQETVRVNSSSIIIVKQARYSVPARLIGNVLKVHVYDDRLECFLGSTPVITFKRLRWNGGRRPKYINYQHIIPCLARKPQAFRNYVFRDDLFPSYSFKQTWELLDAQLDDRTACKEIVKIMKIASDSGREEEISKYLEGILMQNKTPRLEDIEKHFAEAHETVVEIAIKPQEPSAYDVLLDMSRVPEVPAEIPSVDTPALLLISKENAVVNAELTTPGLDDGFLIGHELLKKNEAFMAM
jgi:hypothetical protein